MSMQAVQFNPPIGVMTTMNPSGHIREVLQTNGGGGAGVGGGCGPRSGKRIITITASKNKSKVQSIDQIISGVGTNRVFLGLGLKTFTISSLCVTVTFLISGADCLCTMVFTIFLRRENRVAPIFFLEVII